MGAECDQHGVDLGGDTTTGLVCPVCEVEHERDEARAETERLRAALAGEEAGDA